MGPPSEAQAHRIVEKLLSEWLGTDAPQLEESRQGADWSSKWKGRTLLIEYKRSTEATSINGAIAQVLSHAKRAGKRAVPIVAVPYMGEVGQRLCAEAGVDWLDLSGNASIRVDGLVIQVRGNENRFKRLGRPSTAFSPKAARITRQLLIHPDTPLLQKELAEMADLGAGYTSKIVHRLEEDGLLLRSDDGRVKPKDPALLLDAWSEQYAFHKHHVVRGHVAARTSDALLKKVSSALRASETRHAATGLAGAWLLTKFATFRVTTVFVEAAGPDVLMEAAGFREEPRGANTWLVVPNDEGVFHGATPKHGVVCAHPVQVYLDLLNHPERAQEAAEEVRKLLLPARRN